MGRNFESRADFLIMHLLYLLAELFSDSRSDCFGVFTFRCFNYLRSRRHNHAQANCPDHWL